MELSIPAIPGGCDETLSGTNNENYAGCQTTTQSGYVCQAWNTQTPHPHSFGTLPSNYCRNPDTDEFETIMCYTTDPDVEFDLCDPLPSPNVEKSVFWECGSGKGYELFVVRGKTYLLVSVPDGKLSKSTAYEFKVPANCFLMSKLCFEI